MILRPTLWFVTAYTIIILVHEAAHAVVAVALGIPSTLFNFWVNHEFAHATTEERAVIFIAGPTISLITGCACAFAYRRTRPSAPARLPLLYLAAFGITNFFGNLMSVAFIGDFSTAAVRLGVPHSARVATAVFGAIVVVGVLFVTGRELRQWTLRHSGRSASLLWLIAAPAVIGTAIIVAFNQPTPMGTSSFAMARAGESAFWVFAALGLLTAREHRDANDGWLRFRWLDGAVALAVVLAVRIAARGVPLGLS